MNLDDSVQIAEARLVLRWAAQTLTEMERDCISNFLMAQPDAPLVAKYSTTADLIHYHRKQAMKKLKARLQSLGISKCADLLSSADIKPEIKTRPLVTNKPIKRKRACLDITKGTCKYGHPRAMYCYRKPSGKIECKACRRVRTKTPEGRAAQNAATRRWRSKIKKHSGS